MDPGVDPGDYGDLLQEGSQVPLRMEERVDPPEWLDQEKFKCGKDVFRKYFFSMMIGKLSGLLSVISIPAINKVLVLTQQSHTSKKAYYRYLHTITEVIWWYEGDVWAPENRAHKGLMKVKLMHHKAQKCALESNLMISQTDMTITQFGFIGLVILCPRKLGLLLTEREVEGVTHFWRAIGYLLGIEDRFNLCNRSVEEMKRLCSAILFFYIIPNVSHPNPEYANLSDALLKAMGCIVPFINDQAYRAYTLGLLTLTPDVTASGCYARAMYRFQRFVMETFLHTRFLGRIGVAVFNGLLRLALRLASCYPELVFRMHSLLVGER